MKVVLDIFLVVFLKCVLEVVLQKSPKDVIIDLGEGLGHFFIKAKTMCLKIHIIAKLSVSRHVKSLFASATRPVNFQ